MREKLPYPESAGIHYPPGKTPDRRRIEKCSDRSAWYKNKVGEIITVHYFVAYGAWDMEGRWLWYYDLSAPITNENSVSQKTKSFFKKLFG